VTVFVSYARQDVQQVEGLSRDIGDLVGSVWVDKSLTGGQPWWDEILRQLRACELLVFAMSTSSLRSEACLAETSYAAAVGRPILAVRIGDVEMAAAPDEIRRTQVIDYRTSDLNSLKVLARALISAPKPRPLPEPLPSPPPVPKSYRDRYTPLFSQRLGIDDQVALLGRLKLDIADPAYEVEARELLQLLCDRQDVSWKVRQDIESLFAERSSLGTHTGVAPESPHVPAGWYADPAGRFELRYWDGIQWSEHVSRGGQGYIDPPVT
jgi:hypothetical protein